MVKVEFCPKGPPSPTEKTSQSFFSHEGVTDLKTLPDKGERFGSPPWTFEYAIIVSP